MSLRYFIEMAFFVFNVLFFQYFITKFNTDMHMVTEDIEMLLGMGYLVENLDGRIHSHNEDLTSDSFTATEWKKIEETKAHLDHEIELAELELDEAMLVAMVSFSFPMQFLMTYIYARYTDRVFVVRMTSYIDLGIFGVVLFWFEKYEEYLYTENDGFGLSDPPKQSHLFMQRLINDIKTGEFHFDWLLSSVAFLFWIRLIFLLQLTLTFGPLILATQAMMKDLIVFFGLFTIQLIAFSCVGILTFGSLKEYATLENTIVMLT